MNPHDRPDKGFWLPDDEGLSDAVSGGGTAIPLQEGYAWHLPATIGQGAHSGDERDDWYAETMGGRGQGWRHNWRLRFDD